jgi:hypothetical protein
LIVIAGDNGDASFSISRPDLAPGFLSSSDFGVAATAPSGRVASHYDVKRSWLGFRFQLQRDALGEFAGLGLPMWFLTGLSGASLWLCWRLTRRRKVGAAFEVVGNANAESPVGHSSST